VAGAYGLDETESERQFQQATKEKIAGVVIQGGKSRTLLISELGKELADMRDSLNRRLQDAYMEVSNGHRRHGHRSSTHRTSFIEYVSEVVNARTGGGGSTGGGGGGGLMEALSIRGHSISSGSVASGGSGGLARDFSVRSEISSTTHTSNRVLGGRSHTTRSKTSRVIGE